VSEGHLQYDAPQQIYWCVFQMAGLTDRAGGDKPPGGDIIEQARHAWQESMLRQIDRLRVSLHASPPEIIADRCGGSFDGDNLGLTLWGDKVTISWPDLNACHLPDGEPCSTFDSAMLLYYLVTADGAPMSDRWISFRELPDGAFYNQAFQGYSGNVIAHTFRDNMQGFDHAARELKGTALPALAPLAFAFQPLPRIRIACALWPGDDEFPTRASVLFDAAASHYMPTDGLALLGAGLARRLIKLANPSKS
jgi:hypothetical protein